ncbi:efflux RND transporter periplasmic adaptor subunit [Chitinophaga nivalis]|uniref:Efflux RND transporter periplasmic adaptor subunit n=1 Tax=Chitinophaga nivalis TaxID=2991709 RepID=A0ABT3IQX2_9BACT|nr:efflux RND transporter periplasmic adaptor subunit [Chitinophaga nivalis]MCW3464150.1 efflux RND transporter periplasmic adaptor subunit [Chitinophaga nivalis]MCW3486160.1 efflux RND transporter periplasmic adaptor subunit [Chitinophaga nivalis]
MAITPPVHLLHMKQIVRYTGIAAMMAACHSKQPATDSQEYTIQGDTITVQQQAALQHKLKLVTITARPYQLQLQTAGTVKAIPTQYAEIAPPFPGRILRSFTRLGMTVTPATPLFEISSPDFIEAQKQYFQARSQYQLAQQTFNRQQDLMKHGVTSQKDLEEAGTAFDIAKKELENATAGIRIFKAVPEKLSLGQPLTVYAPIRGEIIDNKIVVGQFIKDDAASVATVAELSDVWVAGQVKEKDLRLIKTLDACEIAIAALPEKHIKGNIYHINEIVDEETRSVQVLIACSNADHTLKPGMYVTVDFTATPTKAVMVPAKALLQLNEQSFVFVCTAPGKYIRRSVTTGSTSGNEVVITAGLQGGEQIVAEGGFYLLEAK